MKKTQLTAPPTCLLFSRKAQSPPYLPPGFLEIQYIIQSHRQLFLVHQKISRHGRANHIYINYLFDQMNVWIEKVL